MNWNKLKQLEKFTIPKVGEGMAQVFNNLSTPPPIQSRLRHHRHLIRVILMKILRQLIDFAPPIAMPATV